MSLIKSLISEGPQFQPGDEVRISSAHPDVGGSTGKIVKKDITGEYLVKVGRKTYSIAQNLLKKV